MQRIEEKTLAEFIHHQ